MLTVLVRLGGRISPEITMLLSFFQLQIETAIRNLMEPVTISLSFVDELQQIVVLLQVVPNDLKDTYKPIILDGIAYLQKHPKLLASLTTVGNTQEQQLHEDVNANGISKLVTKILDRLAEVATLGERELRSIRRTITIMIVYSMTRGCDPVYCSCIYSESLQTCCRANVQYSTYDRTRLVVNVFVHL